MRNFPDLFKKLGVILLAITFSLTTMQGQLNRVDARGLKQGAWIIDGAMSKDPDFAPHEKIEEGDYFNNEKKGLWKRYWPGGELRSEIYYVDGKPSGPYKLYYADGQPEESGYWENGKHTRAIQRYYANGRMKEELQYDSEGNRQGLQRYYHENGSLALEVTMQDGAEHGMQKRYDGEGQLMDERQFENGKVKAGSAKSFITPSQTKSAQMSGMKPGSDLQTNGAQAFEPNGYNVLYNKNGQVSMVGDFINGQLYNGRIQHYDANGMPAATEIYTRGRSTGRAAASNNNQ